MGTKLEALRGRVEYLELFVGQSADKHARYDPSARAFARGADQCTLQERVVCIERFLGDSEKLISDGAKLGKLHKEFDALQERVSGVERAAKEYTALSDRTGSIESFIHVAASKHSKWDAGHDQLRDLHG